MPPAWVSVQPGMGCDGGRYANHQRRVDDRHVGTERLMEQRVLDPFSGSLMTQALVTSEPVPLVVGIATQVSTGRPPCWLNQTIALAASIAEPPPKPITTCGRRACICAIPFATV